ncbi:uncharacterized protein LOC122011238 [Zingiber officinale]|uniref:uncharacterized protein LOC122011238 n=1 Tax=Zingiber officinale TaxID=94328 RepID=UPI001C4C84FB|nr:uncharacterized protein LOC122011238 [Zingiber officinale]
MVLQYHPLNEIAKSSDHLHLFKLWQPEEDRHGRRAVVLEARMDAAKRTVFHLSCLLLSFHGLSFTLLFIASVADTSCRGWWFPCSLSLTTSLVVTVAVQVVVRTYWRILRRLQREREDERALAWCVREMRMKGQSESYLCSTGPEATEFIKFSIPQIK